ncbi:putative late blight resistance protein homolog R1B-16 isoform X2 [Salvia hispanica]|nr:putative late blight resistance protein homolog R1B-16 isoform X2 [Salvia hispanica]XP_047967965.1 putative late blight resistance protein homolog R1B-16 isoform X2 [Salvia hispanica]
MWSEKTWDEVRIYFPDNVNGSRIILTTRLEDVAACADSSKNFHQMKFLKGDESWDLLKKQVFKSGNYPPILEKIGRKIALTCGGLPLAIVVIAGILSEVSRTEADWEQVANNLNLATTAHEEKYAAILDLSYTHLPHHLRSCFLYMGAFPEDYEIRSQNLVKLWVAEGFVQSEEVAEEFLMDLVKRNLVLVKKRKSNGRIKSCGLHDLLRDLCLVRAVEENFLLYFMGKFVLPEIFEDQVRISVSYSDNLLEIDGSTIQTIICYQRSKIDSLEKFKLLSILDMVKADLPVQVFELLQLKHLALSSPTVIPSSVLNLQNLETLIIYPREPCMVTLPDEIWKMSRLRHLIASSFHPLPHPDGETPPLQNLQTLSLVTNFVCSERMVVMIPNIKKLGICYSDENLDGEWNLENLQCLDQLEKLKMEIRGDFPSRPCLKPGFYPELLKKLTLSGWRLPWKDLSTVGSLPNLQVLKLQNYACDGSVWETSDDGFKELEFLLVDESNLEEWSTESSHFPKLKSLVFQRCPYLSEIPDDIGYIPALELIEVDGRNKHLVESAERIQKEQETEYENYSIRVRY